MRRHTWLIAALLLLGLWAWTQRSDNGAFPAPAATSKDGIALPPLSSPPSTSSSPATTSTAARYPAFLPAEAHEVLQRIARGGPYEYRQDAGVFQNRERELPPQPRGYYREYTVETPGSRDRGARRLITGGDPPVEYFYTDDHYRSFHRFELANDGARR